MAAANAQREQCAICVEMEQVCDSNCNFAPYFPNEVLEEYEWANQLFGTTKIIQMMELAPDGRKHDLASAILEEGVAWAEDPIQGGYGRLTKLMWDVELRKAYLFNLKDVLQNEKKQTQLDP